MTGYSVEIKETSRELSAKQRIALKDTSDAIKLDTACEEGAIIIEPIDFAVLSIHNEKSDNVDYENYVIIDKNGDKYVTGSSSFWSSFKGIYDEMAKMKLGQSKLTSLTAKTTKERNSLLVQLSR